MTFSGLETILITGFVSFVIGGSVAVAVHLRSVSPKQCQTHRTVCSNSFQELKELCAELKKSNDIQFRMLRLLVSHLELPSNVRADILNMGPTEKK